MTSLFKTPILLTPGPITTAPATKYATLHDYGSRDSSFLEISRDVCQSMLNVAEATSEYACVPLQGSGTFAVEAMLGAFLSPSDKLLVLANGAYGRRIAEICIVIGRKYIVETWAETETVDPAKVRRVLSHDPSISHVAIVHCETTSGLINDIATVAKVVADCGRVLLVDAISSFGCLDLGLSSNAIAAVAVAANKCLESIPGVSFVIAKKDLLGSSRGRAHSLSLDICEQWRFLQETGQWRFTPPVQAILALQCALKQYVNSGGRAARYLRYSQNCATLIQGMTRIGLRPVIDADIQSPVIVAFHYPTPNFDFDRFYNLVLLEGYNLYPGKFLTIPKTFRVGCIGDIDQKVMCGAVDAMERSLTAIGILAQE